MIKENELIIYKVCSLYVSEEFSVEDLYQETVLNLWRAFPGFRHECSRSTYIYRVALNTCISGLRRAGSRGKHVSLNLLDELAFVGESAGEDVRELYSLIRRLDKFERSLILLWLEEKPYREIAEITGLSLSNVATKLKRIKDKLIKLSNQ
jgi:RNA polymerase sigma-70 factor (ECF subfamily)